MSIEVKQTGQNAQVTLAGDLTIYAVADIKAALSAVMLDADEIEVDLSGITEMDTAGLQLMLIAKRRPGKTVRFVNHSPIVLRLIDLANLGGVLGDLMVVDAVES